MVPSSSRARWKTTSLPVELLGSPDAAATAGCGHQSWIAVRTPLDGWYAMYRMEPTHSARSRRQRHGPDRENLRAASLLIGGDIARFRFGEIGPHGVRKVPGSGL